jgi:uncharacterized protein (DUF2249 family)
MTRSVRLVELRDLQASDGYGRILEAFDGLAAGESLVVVGDEESRAVLRRLQSERKGLFEWSPLETGPSFRTEVTRRAAVAGAKREVEEALAWDHDRLDALEQRAFALLAGRDAQGARSTWAEFAVGLKRHIRFEEEILFPAFEERVGAPPASGPTAVMRSEHREIERLVDLIGGALAGEGAAFELRAELQRVLGEHNTKEEHVIYPATDRSFGPDERDALVARIQAS